MKKSEFWNGKNYALIGVSSNKHKFGNAIYKEMKKRGFTVFPVNQNLTSYDGGKCFSSLKEISDWLDGVVICAKPEKAVPIVQDCIERKISKIWFQQGSHSPAAIKLAQENNIEIYSGSCALLYLEPVKFPHSIHRWFVKVLGKLD
jgi:predicted CoA-binding protein